MSKKCSKHLHQRSTTVDFDARRPSFPALPLSPASSVPDKNASLCTQGPILCLKSHLHLCAPCAVLPFLHLLRPSDCLVCQPRSSPPAAAATRGPQTPSLSSSYSPSRFCTRPDHTCHLHRTRGPGTLAAGAFIHPITSPFRASHPLIPAPCH